ncbi:prolyl 3-hydroxylase 2-like [Uloborus diversus]|uniref:prolyl 3-hydroxylase 2-like n=1 Tax=Uloborus diversus TaxID=327109 RepID=UPI002408F7A9|nr:prolyl 3-hydroxylase 2-like [Uloborus diversus]
MVICSDLFLKGALLYSEGKFADSIEVIEASLKEYLIAEENCRFLCEGSLPELMQEELFVSITNHWTYSLRCKLNCPKKLSYMFGQKHDQLFTNHYHYLQFNYYKVNKFKETCAAVQSFLLFHPNDETMLANKHFYASQPSISEDWFTPRKEAVDYYTQYKRESNLLEAIENFFKLENTSETSKSPMPPPGSSAKAATFSHENLGKKKDKLSEKEITAWFKSSDILPVMKERELNGSNRVVFSNVVSENECQQLMDLAEGGGLYGDGYNGKESPHTQFEMFEGLTVARAAMLSQRGILNPLAAELFLNVSEKARKAVEVFFNLETELFFAYTHLVCRTALPDSTSSRQDLSHPIHADNCILKSTGECLKEKPAYTWRDYSSIVYLNEDFEGGEFIFAKNKNKIQASIKPKCGHMVAFSAGKENLHGVKAVKKGRRCALAMWYTLNSFYRERERDFAETVLHGLWNKRQLANRVTKSDYVKSALHKFVENTKQEHLHVHSEL